MKNARNTSSEPGIERIPLGMKLGYAIGDYGANLAFQATNFYLLFYFTDVFGIMPALAGTIFLYSKIWNAVSNPLMGYIVDRTTSRWGKMRPYLLFGAVPLAVSVMALFFSPPIDTGGRFYYGLAAFVIFCSAITVVNVPYLALTPSLTLDSHERSVLTGYRVFLGIAGSLTAAGATLPLVGAFGGTDKIIGFRGLGILYGIIIGLSTLICFFSVRERHTQAHTEKTSLRESIRLITSNRPFIFLTLGTFMHMIAMNIMAVDVNYFFKYNLKAESLIPIAFLCLFITAGLSLPLFVFISKKTSKKFTYNLGMGIVAAVLVIIFFYGERSVSFGDITMPLTVPMLIAAGVGLSTNWLSPWSMIPDTVEYSEWKTGVRREGILYGVFYFVFMIATALAGFLTGQILSYTGYTANVEQSENTLLGIRIVLTLLPMVFLILGIVFISFFSIDASLHRSMVDEIDKRGGGSVG